MSWKPGKFLGELTSDRESKEQFTFETISVRMRFIEIKKGNVIMIGIDSVGKKHEMHMTLDQFKEHVESSIQVLEPEFTMKGKVWILAYDDTIAVSIDYDVHVVVNPDENMRTEKPTFRIHEKGTEKSVRLIIREY